MYIVWLGSFWLVQAMAQSLFKYGSVAPGKWLFGFIAGNVFGASSIWLLMLLYRCMNPNLALGLGTAGGFLCAQLALAVLFKSSLTISQYAAMASVAVGMGLFAIGAKS